MNRNLNICRFGAGKTIRRKYEIVNWMGETIDEGILLHKQVMGKDNPYRQGAELSDGHLRLQGHIKQAWLDAGGKELEPPDIASVRITKK